MQIIQAELPCTPIQNFHLFPCKPKFTTQSDVESACSPIRFCMKNSCKLSIHAYILHSIHAYILQWIVHKCIHSP